jgi:spermidine synthase
MRRTLPVLLIFVLSGAAGLIYEVVWARQLVLVFGNTTQAVSAILTGFFGGMAIGSALGGRLADRVRRPLRLYGLLELILVIVVLATPITFRLLHEVYRGAFGTLETAPLALALVRFALSLLALGPATILMGATLPTLTRHLSRGAGDLSTAFGRLYAANTIGAIVGAAAAGFVLIELLGLSGTLIVGAICSGAAGLIALALDAGARHALEEGKTEPPATEPAAGSPAAAMVTPSPVAPTTEPGPATSGSSGRRLDRRARLAIVLAFVSGLTSLAYQVLWTRLIASGTGNYTYVFSLILVVFLSGLALGALAFNFLRPRLKSVIDLLAAGQIAIAVLATLGVVVLVGGIVDQPLALPTSIGDLFGDFARSTILIVLPTTFVMGLTFPAASALIAGRDDQVGSRAGLLLASNTLGAIIATFAIPFIVIPLVGSPVALGLVAIVNAVTGVAVALGGRIERPGPRVVTGTAGVVVALGLVVSIAGGGLFIDPSIARIQKAGGVLYQSAEDEIASVQAGELHGAKQLWVTGVSMTILTVDAKLMPIIPLIFRPDSTTELTIAFGMGSAYRAALIAGLKVDGVELVPSVPDMFGNFYSDAAQVLADPNGHLIISDGRNHVELTDRTYDIIVVDPPPPVQGAGVSVISSREFYEAARARLNPGGIMMQWVPYDQTLDEFKAHVRTFDDVFPNMMVAAGPGGFGYYMFGSDQPFGFTDANMRSVLSRPGVLEDISSAYDSPRKDLEGWVALLPHLIRLQGDQVSQFTGPGPLVTDDRPLPEYFLLRHLFGPQSPQLSPEQVVP